LKQSTSVRETPVMATGTPSMVRRSTPSVTKMRRVSRRKRDMDNRRFDLFVSERASSLALSDGRTPLSKDEQTTPYEAEVLDAMVGLLRRQWNIHLKSNPGSRERH